MVPNSSREELLRTTEAPTTGIIGIPDDIYLFNKHVADEGSQIQDSVRFFAENDGTPPATGVALVTWLQGLTRGDLANIKEELQWTKRCTHPTLPPHQRSPFSNLRASQPPQPPLTPYPESRSTDASANANTTSSPPFSTAALGATHGYDPTALQPEGPPIYWKDVFANITGVPALDLHPFTYTVPFPVEEDDEWMEDELLPSEYTTPYMRDETAWLYTIDITSAVLTIRRDRDWRDEQEWTWTFATQKPAALIRDWMLRVEAEANGWPAPAPESTMAAASVDRAQGQVNGGPASP